MKKRLSFVCLSGILGVTFLAAGQDSRADVHIQRFDFSAPSVFGISYVANPQIGDIVYDQTAAGFYGYTQSGTWINMASAPHVPTVQKFTSGSGTYVTPINPSPFYIRVRMLGGGGGGGGGGNGSGTGGAGGTTTFGTSLLTANGGSAGGNNSPGTGGSATVATGATSVLTLSGGNAGVGSDVANGAGGLGGVSNFGGNGQSTIYGGSAAVTNSGSGGGGGQTSNAAYYAGGGGGAGSYLEALINSPGATYSFSVGAGGAGGSAGTSGSAGGPGGSGIIIVEEYYQ